MKKLKAFWRRTHEPLHHSIDRLLGRRLRGHQGCKLVSQAVLTQNAPMKYLEDLVRALLLAIAAIVLALFLVSLIR